MDFVIRASRDADADANSANVAQWRESARSLLQTAASSGELQTLSDDASQPLPPPSATNYRAITAKMGPGNSLFLSQRDMVTHVRYSAEARTLLRYG